MSTHTFNASKAAFMRQVSEEVYDALGFGLSDLAALDDAVQCWEEKMTVQETVDYIVSANA